VSGQGRGLFGEVTFSRDVKKVAKATRAAGKSELPRGWQCLPHSKTKKGPENVEQKLGGHFRHENRAGKKKPVGVLSMSKELS
jgi:hypothetical protein